MKGDKPPKWLNVYLVCFTILTILTGTTTILEIIALIAG